jgi:translation initiation factor 2-alpha kinase 4
VQGNCLQISILILLSSAKPDSPHHQAVLSSLFNQPPSQVRGFLYDLDAETPEHASLNDIVQGRLAAIFRLHGALDVEPPLLMPVLNIEDETSQATFLDRHGDVVTLSNNILVPFARLAARGNIKRIKRYHITNVYRPKYDPYVIRY